MNLTKNLILAALGLVALFLGWDLINDFKIADTTLNSPVLGISKLHLADNLWFPKQTPKTFLNAPEMSKLFPTEITAKAAFFVETQTGEVLYQKNAYQKYPVASLVKIMTAIVALENKSLEEKFIVSQRAADMEADKMYLQSFETLNLEELLHGMFLVSANDAAEVIAEGTTGRREEFINLMNSKALSLGMKDSIFINPTGLEEEGDDEGKLKPQYSSAFDVAIMSRYAIKTWPKLVEISSKPEVYFDANSNHQAYYLLSGINLLTTYPGVVGFKTGYTPEAGLTLVTLARNSGGEVLGVLLGSTNRRDDARYLLDYSFNKLGI